MSRRTFTLGELAELTSAELIGDSSCVICGVNSLEEASPEEASFLANARYRETMMASKAGLICIDRETDRPEGKHFLISDEPSITFQRIISAFHSSEESKSGFTGIHPTAIVHEEAKIGSNVQLGPYVVIDRNATIGNGTRLDAHVSIGPNVKIGTNCHFHTHSIVREGSLIGNYVILQPGAVIGSCGFGYTTDKMGVHHKLEQLGSVIIEDHVEIGANTTIDRARFKTTRICQGTKIDNLVQIGHNVHLGPGNIIVSQTGIAGSAKTGRHVVIGGQCGIVGHLEIPDGTMIASRGGVSKTIKKAGKYSGAPIMPIADYNRQQVHLRKISKHIARIESLEERLKKLEASS